MRAFLMLVWIAATVSPAWANIEDSGSLLIGGQGIIGGTVTVQGSALGVAGAVSATSATLSGSGSSVYSLTSSSGIHVVNGKLKFEAGSFIEWADLSKSTTASAGGGGNAILSATQTFSGANTFSSSIVVPNSASIALQAGSTMTAGPTVYSSTLSVTGRIVGQENLVAVSSGNGLSAQYFYGFSGSTTPPAGYYKIFCRGVKNTTGNIYWQANGDANNNYEYYMCGGNISNYCSLEGSVGQTSHGQLSGGIESIRDASGFMFEATFATQKANSNLMAPFVADYMNGGGGGNTMTHTYGSSLWRGGSAFSSLKIYFSAGTADMYCFVKQFITDL